MATLAVMKLSDKISMLVERADLNASRLAKLAGVSHTAVGKWMRGENVPGLLEASRLARALGVSMEYLADESLDEPPHPEMTDAERAVITAMRGLDLEPEIAIRAISHFAKLKHGGEMVQGPLIRHVEMAGPSATHAKTRPAAKGGRSGKAKDGSVSKHKGSDVGDVPTRVGGKG